MKKLPIVTAFDRLYAERLELDDLFIARGTSTRIVVKDSTSLDQVVFEGHNLKYRNGVIQSGTIEKITLADDHGRPHEVLSNLHINAANFTGETMYDYALTVTQQVSAQSLKFLGASVADRFSGTNGNDLIFGRKGDDVLSGGKGRDFLTGGAGSDTFQFAEGYGKDVITDFDAVGGAGHQDLIQHAVPELTSIHKSGHDTIIDFGDGDSLTLLGVKPSQIDVSDFLVN